ncbi:MAG: sulfite exporter TauE/SafE family protein [Rhodovibrionaceae bacterium]|nr:sulfite exporter TauE/SafE family protein [Rhodovibrionaceae bacterium]
MPLDLAWDAVLSLAGAMLVAGLAAGFVAGLLGVGGGIVIVPVLFQVFTFLGIDPAVKMHLAVGTSLATIILTGALSTRSHHRRGSVDIALLKSWGPAILAGVVLGSVLAGFVSGEALTGVFAAVALIVAAHMALTPEGTTLAARLPGGLGRLGIGAMIGTISTLMGIGGGTLSVPILSLFNYPIRKAVGTAAAIGLIIGVPGTIGFVAGGLGADGLPPLSIGYVNLVGFALIVPASMLMAPQGARAAHAIPQAWLRRAFAAFLFLTSIRLFYTLVNA